MSFEVREAMTDVMRDAFIQERSLGELTLNYVDGALSFPITTEGIDNYQLYYLKILSDLDYDQVEEAINYYLPIDDIDDIEAMSARGQTEHLAINAFDNTKTLVTFAIGAIPTTELEDTDKTTRILHNSKYSLLKIAILDEDTKSRLLNYAKCQKDNREQLSQELWDAIGPDNLVVYNAQDQKVTWSSDIEDWIRSKRRTQKEGQGCPAYSRNITVNDSKTTLINAFWDRAIDYIASRQDIG